MTGVQVVGSVPVRDQIPACCTSGRAGRRRGLDELRPGCDVLECWDGYDVLGDLVGGQALPERFADSLLEFCGGGGGGDYVCRHGLSPGGVVFAAYEGRPDVGKGDDRVLDFL